MLVSDWTGQVTFLFLTITFPHLQLPAAGVNILQFSRAAELKSYRTDL